MSDLESKQNIHELGVNYIRDLLDRVGFTIHEVNNVPNHHFQIFAQVKNRAMLIAVRTAYYPDFGTLDQAAREELIKESKQLEAVPHFAGLSLTSVKLNDIQEGGVIKEGEFEIIFNGMNVVR